MEFRVDSFPKYSILSSTDVFFWQLPRKIRWELFLKNLDFCIKVEKVGGPREKLSG